MKKYIVTGASGFIGKNLVKALAADQDNYIYAVVRNSASDVSCFSQLENVKIVKCELDDIRSLQDFFRTEKIKTMIHLAWEGSTGAKRADFELQMRNTIRTVWAYELAEALSCEKFLCAGTISERVLDQLEQLENISQNMIYALAKRTAYQLLTVKSKTFHTQLVWMQFSNVFGPGNTSGNLIGYTMKSIKSGEVPEFGSGNQPYNFIYIDDLIKAIICLDESRLNKQIYFLGSGECRLLKDYLIDIPIALGMDIPLGIGKRPEDGIIYKTQWFDCSELFEDTGFCAEISFKEGIRRSYKDMSI